MFTEITEKKQAIAPERALTPSRTLWDKASDLFISARPKQWTKNLIIFAPVIFAAKIFDTQALMGACFCTLAFCLVSSGVYLLNDVLDREQDRIHPKKRKRPIAMGRI